MFSRFYAHDGVTSLLVLTPDFMTWLRSGTEKDTVPRLVVIRSLLLTAPHQCRPRCSLLTNCSIQGRSWMVRCRTESLRSAWLPGWSKWHHHQTSTSLVEWDDRLKCTFKKDTSIHFHLKSSLLLLPTSPCQPWGIHDSFSVLPSTEMP